MTWRVTEGQEGHGEEGRGPIRQDLAGREGVWIFLREFRQVSKYLKTNLIHFLKRSF